MSRGSHARPAGLSLSGAPTLTAASSPPTGRGAAGGSQSCTPPAQSVSTKFGSWRAPGTPRLEGSTQASGCRAGILTQGATEEPGTGGGTTIFFLGASDWHHPDALLSQLAAAFPTNHEGGSALRGSLLRTTVHQDRARTRYGEEDVRAMGEAVTSARGPAFPGCPDGHVRSRPRSLLSMASASWPGPRGHLASVRVHPRSRVGGAEGTQVCWGHPLGEGTTTDRLPDKLCVVVGFAR